MLSDPRASSAAAFDVVPLEYSSASRQLILGHVLGRQGERNLAWNQVELASQLVGDSIYTDFLKNLEYGCLTHKQPTGPSER